MKLSQDKLLIIFAFFAIYVIWGSTYMLNKIAVAELPPFLLASFRFTNAGILILLIARLLGQNISISKKELWNTVIAGFLFLTFGNGIVVWALKYVDSGFAALEISAQPLVVLLLMFILQGKKIQPSSWIGVALGILGIYLLVSQDQITSQENAVLGMLMIFSCLISWGYGSLFVAKADMPKNFFINTGYQMLMGGLMMIAISFLLGEQWTSPLAWSNEVKISMFLLIVFGSIVAFTAFNYLLKKVSPEKVATNTYVNPIVALILGAIFLKEQISVQSIIAAVILLTGVYFINTKKEFPRPKRV